MTNHNQWVIDVKNLGRKFNKLVAVYDITLKIKRGEIFGFIGPNGSGKTTTIRMLCGLLTPSHGEGYCLGYDITKPNHQLRNHIGYVTQYFSLYNDLTIYENLLFRAKLFNLSNPERKIQVMMEQMHLTDRKNQLAAKLSGGLKQRLSLAAALIHEPLLLLLDEPTSGLDPNSKQDFWQIIYRLSAQGTTVLLSSHNIDEIERCHRIGNIVYGHLLMSGSVQELIEKIGLVTCLVTGPNLPLLAEQLRLTYGVKQVITTYAGIKISSDDTELLEEALKPYKKLSAYTWQPIPTKLEDVFVWLVATSEDSRYDSL